MHPTAETRPATFTLTRGDQNAARQCVLQLIQEVAISPAGSLPGVELFDVTAKGSNLRRAIRLDWERLADNSLYWRNRAADTQATSVDGAAFLLQCLVAMAPDRCPIPYTQAEALNFAPWLFSGHKLTFVFDEHSRKVLDADLERRLSALRRRLHAWMNNTVDKMGGPIAFKQAMESVLSTVKMPESVLRLGGVRTREWHTYVDLVTLQRSLIANPPRPHGPTPGLQLFSDDAEHEAIVTDQRTGVSINAGFAFIYLPTYVEQVWDSQTLTPWYDRHQLTADNNLSWGAPLPEELAVKIRKQAAHWVSANFEAAPSHQCESLWNALGYGVPYNPQDVLVVRQVASSIATTAFTDPSAEAALDAQVVAAHSSSGRRKYERAIYRVDIPASCALNVANGYVSYVWPIRGVYVDVETMKLTPQVLLQRFQELHAATVRFRQGGVDNKARESAIPLFLAQTHKVNGVPFVSWELVKALCPEMPEPMKQALVAAFERPRDLAFASAREAAVMAQRGLGKVVRANLPFTLEEDKTLWSAYKRYAPDSYWADLAAKMPRQSITRIKRRCTLIHKAQQAGLTMEQMRDEDQLRAALPNLGEHYDNIMLVC
jgi:hypothetical protein